MSRSDVKQVIEEPVLGLPHSLFSASVIMEASQYGASSNCSFESEDQSLITHQVVYTQEIKMVGKPLGLGGVCYHSLT